MTTFRDNKQRLHDIFQYVLTTPSPLQNSITITEEKYHRLPTQQTKSDTIQKGMFFSPNSDYTYFSEDLMIRLAEPVKIPIIRVFFKIISGHQF